MQTFLPFPSFNQSASCLDYKRLGKQRLEAKIILDIISGNAAGKGWINHPATRMWRGHHICLANYGITMCSEWKNRGYKDNLGDHFRKKLEVFQQAGYSYTTPNWMGNLSFHQSHRAALLFKLPGWYSKFGWNEKPEINYIWPV